MKTCGVLCGMAGDCVRHDFTKGVGPGEKKPLAFLETFLCSRVEKKPVVLSLFFKKPKRESYKKIMAPANKLSKHVFFNTL